MPHGLRINLKNSNFLTTHPNETSTVSRRDLPKTEPFKNLGSTLLANGELHYKIDSPISSSWIKWCSTTDVLWDRPTNEPPKFKIYDSIRCLCYPIRLQVLGSCKRQWTSTADNGHEAVVKDLCHSALRSCWGDIPDQYGIVPIVEEFRVLTEQLCCPCRW